MLQAGKVWIYLNINRSLVLRGFQISEAKSISMVAN